MAISGTKSFSRTFQEDGNFTQQKFRHLRTLLHCLMYVFERQKLAKKNSININAPCRKGATQMHYSPKACVV